MTVRPRTEADLPGCVAALREVQEHDNYPTRWPDDPAAWLSPPGQLGAWVAELDATIVGQVGALDGASEPGIVAATGIPDLVLVTRLFTTPAARGHGLARALVDAVVAFARPRRAGLDVMAESHDAIALYERLGWTFAGHDTARWTTQRGEHPAIRYYLAPAPPSPPP